MTTTDTGTGAPAADTGTEGEGAVTDAGLEAIAPAEDPWAEPPELDEGVNQFDRDYVAKLRDQAASYRVKAKELNDRWDGVDHDAATNGMYLAEALQTPEGVREFFVEAGAALGLDQRQLFALLSGQTVGAPAATQTEEPPDPNEVMTRADFQAELAKAIQPIQQTQEQAAQAARQAQMTQIVTSVVDDELKLGGDENKAERDIVMAIADGIIDPNEQDPRKAAAALRQAKQQWDATKQAQFAQYTAQKAATTKAVPKTLGSNTGGASAAVEDAPKSLAEAIERRKAGKTTIK